jgi:N-methylhydantoinase B
VPGRRLASWLTVDHDNYMCTQCGGVLGEVGKNVRTFLVREEVSVRDRWPITMNLSGSDRFVIRHFYCPCCAAQVDMEVALAGQNEPVHAIEVLA